MIVVLSGALLSAVPFSSDSLRYERGPVHPGLPSRQTLRSIFSQIPSTLLLTVLLAHTVPLSLFPPRSLVASYPAFYTV